VTFSIAIHDTCCLDENNLGLAVTADLPSGNATLGQAVVDSVNVLGPRDIEVVGHANISALESCPAQVVISAQAQDCQGNQVTTDEQGSSASVAVLDTTPPEVTPSQANLQCLWPPSHGYVCFDEGDFSPTIHDNCALAPTWQFTTCSSDQPDNGPGDGNTSNDCTLAPGGQSLCARSERTGSGQAGRHYGLTITAADQCSNVSAATGIGAIYVPHDQSPQLHCVSP
jgi:hypothetical protein